MTDNHPATHITRRAHQAYNTLYRAAVLLEYPQFQECPGGDV